MKLKLAFAFLVVGLAAPLVSKPSGHPKLILTQAGVEKIRAELGSVPLFDNTVSQVRAEVDAEIELGIDTPIPQDFSGGYTHERHKKNYVIAQKAGALYQITGEEKYADYVRDMLLQYEAMYKDLPLHPKERSYARGKLFWQCLNDANWLLFMSQAYDTIHGYLSADERSRLENNLFRPFADHISVDSPQFFNRVHNHSTWGSAAVGMIGLAMGDDELVQRALYGIVDDGLELGGRDNDGGFIKVEGQKAGFLANLDQPFSPDGYYTEGPYYQRYAMYPFLVFAQALHNTRPELEIFQHKNGVLINGVDALLQLTNANGEFFALNDAQKGMSWLARELVTAVNIAYHVGSGDPQLLDVARQQGRVLLDDAGFAVARGVRDGDAQPFEKRSVKLSDGANGNQGGLALLRYGTEDLTLLFKYTAHGLSHGHFDKLSFLLFDQGSEVLQDYGMARFVNIGQKGGGNYLPENTTWAKQTIAHNTLVQNETSHFEGKYEIGSAHHSELYFFDVSNSNVQVVSATETNAYPGTAVRRTMAVIRQDGFDKPFVLDLLKVDGSTRNQYDLPFHFLGQVLSVNFDYQTPPTLAPLGEGAGYQHLYLEGKGNPDGENTVFSWLANDRFYTLTSATSSGDEVLLARIGANDPDFNLRRDPALIIRRQDVEDTLFATVIEPHGSYDPVTEIALDSSSNISQLRVVRDDDDYTAVAIEDATGQFILFLLSNASADPSKEHRIDVNGEPRTWTGPFALIEGP